MNVLDNMNESSENLRVAINEDSKNLDPLRYVSISFPGFDAENQGLSADVVKNYLLNELV